MLLHGLWFICVLQHSSFLRAVESRLIEKPKNVAARIGEQVTFHCASENSTAIIRWGYGNDDTAIYKNNNYGADVIEKSDGSSKLIFIASLSKATSYSCVETGNPVKARAQLTVFVDEPMCILNITSMKFNCFFNASGGLTPTMECRQWTQDGQSRYLPPDSEPPEGITLWSFKTLDNENRITCSTEYYKSNKTGKYKRAVDGTEYETAENVPRFHPEIIVREPSKDDPKNIKADVAHASTLSTSAVVLVALEFVIVIGIAVMLLLLTRKSHETEDPEHCVYLIRTHLPKGFVLGVNDCKASPGMLVFPYKQHGGINQQWRDHPPTGTIRSKINPDFCLDIEGGRLVLNRYQQGKSDQQWIRRGNEIANRTEPSVVLNIEASDDTSEVKVIKCQAHGGINQLWTFELV